MSECKVCEKIKELEGKDKQSYNPWLDDSVFKAIKEFQIDHLKKFHCTCSEIKPVGGPISKKGTAKVIFVVGEGITRTAVVDYVNNTPRDIIVNRAWAKVAPADYLSSGFLFTIKNFEYTPRSADGINLIIMCHAELKDEEAPTS